MFKKQKLTPKEYWQKRYDKVKKYDNYFPPNMSHARFVRHVLYVEEVASRKRREAFFLYLRSVLLLLFVLYYVARVILLLKG